MLPFDDYHRKAKAFTKNEFEQNSEKREHVLRMLYDYISESYNPVEGFDSLVIKYMK